MHDIAVLSLATARCIASDAPLFEPNDLAIFQSAYEAACRALGLEPARGEISDDFGRVRSYVATAIIDKGRSGERDGAVLASFAVARGLRHWPLA